jgi:hypothetical protein
LTASLLSPLECIFARIISRRERGERKETPGINIRNLIYPCVLCDSARKWFFRKGFGRGHYAAPSPERIRGSGFAYLEYFVVKTPKSLRFKPLGRFCLKSEGFYKNSFKYLLTI